ncbi:putative ferric-chelate reductase 1 [Melanotaenia boesemani]|uniref:putative ferric-chelate reductase 1 n=1 Tax=Melanotaenia boesemani TaxID=1250792 RepID=UPI001C04102F|nr:putative ferric-chelate reductase 1 [Melanotaenia boesemani]XP_041849136.1 putative ferric-chelate reductase 1 [Melanotaenia boesemani]XP_041849137.1 putative ferric-chelate reductase 1 [Melanotaenia boesemani]
MEQTLILLFTTVMLFVAPGVNADLSFAANPQFSITRTGCAVTKVCVSIPDSCDPAGNGVCLFGSVHASTPTPPNGTQMAFELSGNSSGFIALGLTSNASVGTSMLFVCAQNSSGSFFFQTQTRNNINNTLTSLDRTVTQIQGKVNGSSIQCGFTVPNLNASNTRSASDTTYVIILGSGTVNGNSVGNFTASLTTDPLILTSNIATTAPPSSAVLLLLSMLPLFFLKTA